MCIFEWNFKIVLDIKVENNCSFKKGLPRRHPPSWSIPRSALKTLFVQHEILNPQACVRRAPAPNRHAVWMEKVSATCNGAVLGSHPCMPDGASWAESKAVQCRSVSKKPAFQLTTVSALTSNHGSIAWGKPRLPRCPVPEPVPLPEVQADICCHGQHPDRSLKCLSCLCLSRGCLGIHVLVAVGSHMPGHKAVAILVDCLLSSTPQKLRWLLCSKNPLVVAWAGLLLSLGQ